MKLCWDRCSLVVRRTLDPFSPNYVPPLPRVETLLIALLINIQQLRTDTTSLLPELMNRLRDKVLLTENLRFHAVCAMW